MYEGDSIWSRKGATFSDKSARQEFGLTQQEIIAAIRAGKLQFQQNSMHGNPWFRLLRHEVEALVNEKCGKDGLHKKKLQKELAGCSYNMMLRGECWAAILVDVSPEFLPAAYGESQSAYRQDGSGSLVLPTRTRFA